MAIFYFDMDGTVADLYGIENWLPKIRQYNVSPYREAKPLVNMNELKKVCELLKANGHELGVITWGAGGEQNEQFNRETEQAKREWIEREMPYINPKNFHFLPYGTPKQSVHAKNRKAVLIDDNAEVRQKYQTPKCRRTIDATGNIIQELYKYI